MWTWDSVEHRLAPARRLGACPWLGAIGKPGPPAGGETGRAVAVQSSRPLEPQPLPPVVSGDPTGTSHWPSTELHSPSVLLTRVTSRPLPLSPRWPLLDLRFVWLRPLSPKHRVPGCPLPVGTCTGWHTALLCAYGSGATATPVARSPLWPARAPQVLPLGPLTQNS